MQDVIRERKRQIEVEGWSSDHDGAYHRGVLSQAASCYAFYAYHENDFRSHPPSEWPWEAQWWKPKTPRQDLVRAAALIIAEIDLLDRTSPPYPREIPHSHLSDYSEDDIEESEVIYPLWPKVKSWLKKVKLWFIYREWIGNE